MSNYLYQEAIERKQKTIRYKMYKFIKRLQDMILSLGALIVLSPVFLLISLLIILDDPQGGPFFSQIRCGKYAKPFKMYKFRTMCVEAEKQLEQYLGKNEMDGPAFKMTHDPRITRIGRFLRKTGLDELPQLFNILKGDMALIGPRPPLPREVEKYTECQKHRLDITPGLSCYWQAQPHRNYLTFDQWVELDMKYISDQSYLTDWKIVFMTIKAVVKMHGL